MERQKQNKSQITGFGYWCFFGSWDLVLVISFLGFGSWDLVPGIFPFTIV
ncbi:hypothetical protein [Longitalea luteola]|nr:hypothetical protein [Longitalea luteola]